MRPANLLLGAALVVMACSTAYARIGETFEQCVARYGAPDSGPWSNKADPAAEVYYFTKSGRDIRIIFCDGKAENLVFGRLDKKAFSDSEVQKMLAENKASEWMIVYPERPLWWWESSQGERHAALIVNGEGELKGLFTVWTAEWHEKAYSGKEASSAPLKRTGGAAEAAMRAARAMLGY